MPPIHLMLTHGPFTRRNELRRLVVLHAGRGGPARAAQIAHGNYAPYNFFSAITDTFIPVYPLGLLYAYWHSGGLQGSLRPEAAA